MESVFKVCYFRIEHLDIYTHRYFKKEDTE